MGVVQLLTFSFTDYLRICNVNALIATIIVESDMIMAPIAGDKTIPIGAKTPAANGMAIML